MLDDAVIMAVFSNHRQAAALLEPCNAKKTGLRFKDFSN